MQEKCCEKIAATGWRRRKTRSFAFAQRPGPKNSGPEMQIFPLFATFETRAADLPDRA
jgi:hypothetical protein